VIGGLLQFEEKCKLFITQCYKIVTNYWEPNDYQRFLSKVHLYSIVAADLWYFRYYYSGVCGARCRFFCQSRSESSDASLTAARQMSCPAASMWIWTHLTSKMAPGWKLAGPLKWLNWEILFRCG